ncbi:MAG: DUF2306 domain-containing protein [Bacteroidota bacterium]
MSITSISSESSSLNKIVKALCIALVVTVWTSTLIFGLYILAFYGVSWYEGNLEEWNMGLPNLHDPEEKAANAGIGLHFVMGGIILILGCIQLLEKIRVHFPVFHRWVGRIYVVACLLAAVGGLVFIFQKGTIGGTVMNIGFALYGILMFLAAIQTWRFAMKKQFEQHRVWAIRLFALAIGSWLYRMAYGLWIFLMDGVGIADFYGPFDYVMDFAFYIPNLIIAEIFIRKQQVLQSVPLKIGATLILSVSTGLLVLATYFFTLHYWSPPIIELFQG